MTDAAKMSKENALTEKLSAYPEKLRALVMSYHQNPENNIKGEIVTEILKYHNPDEYESLYASRGDALILVDDMGMDSLTMAEIAFEAEDFLDITISNEDMLSIKTLGDLKSYVEKATV